jgi:flagellar hook-associated protein 3 FlgL
LTPTIIESTPIGYNSGEMDIDFQTMTNYAGNIEGFLLDLMNRQENDRYLFSGSDTLNKPLVSTATLHATMETSISNWKNEASPSNITTAEFIADMRERVATITNPDAFTDTIVGYNPTMTSGGAGNVYARIDANSEVNYTSLANNQGFRDVLVAVSFLKSENLPPIADVYAEPYTFGDAPIEEGAPGATLDEQRNAFYEVFNAVESMINGALKEIDKEIQNLELSRVRLDDAVKTNRDQKALAQSLISDVEDVDMNEVAVKLTAVQTSLDTSYRITAMMSEMSLVNFI